MLVLPTSARSGKGVFTMRGDLSEVEVAIPGILPDIDNLTVKGGRFSITKPSRNKFDVSAAPWSREVDEVCQVLAVFRESKVVEVVARALLEKLRPGASDLLVSLARVADVPIWQLSAYDDRRMTIIPEATPVSRAFVMDLPAHQLPKPGSSRRFDIAELVRAAVAHARIIMTERSYFEEVLGNAVIEYQGQIYHEYLSTYFDTEVTAEPEQVSQLQERAKALPEGLGHPELDHEANKAAQAVRSSHDRLLRLCGYNARIAEEGTSLLGTIERAVRIDPSYDPRGKYLIAVADDYKGIDNPWMQLRETITSKIEKQDRTKDSERPPRKKPCFLDDEGRIAIDHDLDDELLEGGIMMDEAKPHKSEKRLLAIAASEIVQICSVILNHIEVTETLRLAGRDVPAARMDDAQVRWSALMLTAHPDMMVASQARAIGLAPEARASFVENLLDNIRPRLPCIGWFAFQERFDLCNQEEETCEYDLDEALERDAPADEIVISYQVEPDEFEVCLWFVYSGLARGSLQTQAEHVVAILENVPPKDAFGSSSCCYHRGFHFQPSWWSFWSSVTGGHQDPRNIMVTV